MFFMLMFYYWFNNYLTLPEGKRFKRLKKISIKLITYVVGIRVLKFILTT